ncbi:MAG: guanosine monophosphate reductase [Proteobacteria bacterium]|nr:guanosine monophosphate reductase [Pseudomonadota bacterium]
MQRTLCFDDVLLVPQYSEIESRKNVDVSVSGFDDLDAALTKLHSTLKCPIVGSPMDTVISPEVASVLEDFGGFGVLHRYCTIQDSVKMFKETLEKCPGHPLPNIMVAIGATGDYLERATALYESGCRAFCIDVAHGHHSSVKNALKELRLKFGDEVHLMSGNVATLDAFNDLADWGSNSIRVGVGGGSMCSTRIRTGHGIPTLQSLMDCAKSDRDVFIVADGGIRNSGDAVKALAAGADMIMLGSILAGHDECPGDLVDSHGLTYKSSQPIGVPLFKKFRGMASREAQLQWRGRVSVVEGESTMIPYKGSVANTLTDLLEGIKSGISYSGARTIRELRAKAKFVTVTAQGVRENGPHGK